MLYALLLIIILILYINREDITIPPVDDPIDGGIKKQYTVGYQVFTSYYERESSISFKENTFIHLNLDSFVLANGSEFKADEIIGTFENNEIKAKYDGVIINSLKNDKKYDVTVYYFNQFSININLTMYDYYAYDMRTLNSPKLILGGNNSYDIKFKDYDFTNIETEGIVGAIFSCLDCDQVVTSNSTTKINSIRSTEGPYYYLEGTDFTSSGERRMYKTIVDNKEKKVEVNCFGIIDKYALIRSSDIELKKGMVLYE